MTDRDKRIRLEFLSHAAIKLRVPRSGDKEIDAMIRESLQLDLAGQAMQALLRNTTRSLRSNIAMAVMTFDLADSMLDEWNKRNE